MEKVWNYSFYKIYLQRNLTSETRSETSTKTSLAETSTQTSNYLSNDAFYITQITQKRVGEMLVSIPLHNATADDGISAKLLRIAAPACNITIAYKID